MSMSYIRQAYGVPAKRGGRVTYTGNDEPQLGTIKSASNYYLKVLIDGEEIPHTYHPTWAIFYHANAANCPDCGGLGFLDVPTTPCGGLPCLACLQKADVERSPV